MQQQQEKFMTGLVEQSIPLKALLANEAERVKRNKKTSLDRLQDTIESLARGCSGFMGVGMEGERHSATFNQLQDHILQIYQQVGAGFLKKSMAYEEHLGRQEAEWQATCDTILQKHEQYKQAKERAEQDVKQTLANAETQLQLLRQEHSSLVQNSNSLQERLENSVN